FENYIAEKPFTDRFVQQSRSQDIFSSTVHFYATTPYGSKIPKKVQLFLDSLKQHFQSITEPL
ncbi:hypothetical protein GP481_11470, partial [Acinetobacter sp. 105-3]|nr:hypothetical protein [Acinetobacter sp. 105-3]